MSLAPGRVRAFDWMRGLVVPAMIFQHALALLQPQLRDDAPALVVKWLAGFVAPSFLLAAGFALALVQVRAASHGAIGARRIRTARRIAEVLLVGTLVNWMWFPLFREPRWILRLDILQCIGVSLAVAFVGVTLLATRPRVLLGVALAAAVTVFALAPFGAPVEGLLAPLVNNRGDSVFPLSPWIAYVFLGVVFGVIAATRGPIALARALGVMAVLAAGLWALAPWLRDASFYPPHNFAGYNPSEHARRLTFIAVAIAALLHVEHRMPRLAALPPFRILELFGTTSLAAYFFHEALLFFRIGGFSFEAVWGSAQRFPMYALLSLALTALTLGLCWVMDRIYAVISPRVDALLVPAPNQHGSRG